MLSLQESLAVVAESTVVLVGGELGAEPESDVWMCPICAIKPLEQTSKRRFCKVCSSDQRAMKLDAEFKEQDGKPDFLARFCYVASLLAIAWFLVLVSQTSTLWFGYRFFNHERCGRLTLNAVALGARS